MEFISVVNKETKVCCVKNQEGKFNLAYCDNLNEKNFVFDENKAILSFNYWFDKINYNPKENNDFVIGFHNKKWYFINTIGHVIVIECIDIITPFKVCHANASCFNYSPINYAESNLRHKEIAVVKCRNVFNYITKDGELISKKWFDIACEFSIEGWARIKLDGKWNYINILGALKDENKWFDFCRDFLYGYAFVSMKSENYFIDSSTDCKYNLENMRTIFPDDVILHIIGFS